MTLYQIVFVLCLLAPAAVSLLPLDCNDIYKLDNSAHSGVYRIYPRDDTAVEVYCDMDTDEGRWTVFQRRMDGTVSFYRPWNQYRSGFGSAEGEYWLGLENLYHLTFKRRVELRVDMENFTGDTAYAKYSLICIDSEDYGYRLHVAQFKDGSAGDSLRSHDKQKFSTQDRDQDSSDEDCARERLGGFWYYSCTQSNPNGVYMWVNDHKASAINIFWSTWKDITDPLKAISMKIRPLSPREDQDENADDSFYCSRTALSET